MTDEQTADDEQDPPPNDLTKRCDNCGAEPGQHCHRPDGRPSKQVHASRVPTKYRRGPGRPTKLTPQLTTDLCALITGGAAISHASAALGVGISTVMRWLADGLKPGDDYAPYRDFREAVYAARGASATRLSLVLTDAAQGGALKSITTTTDADGRVTRREEYTLPDTKALLEILGRQYPAEWTKRSLLETPTDPALLPSGAPDGEDDDGGALLGPDAVNRLLANAQGFVASKAEQIEGPQPGPVEEGTPEPEEPNA